MNKKKIFFIIIIFFSILFFLLISILFLDEDKNKIIDESPIVDSMEPKVYKIGDHLVGRPDIVTKEKCEKIENENKQKDCYDQLQFNNSINSNNLKECLLIAHLSLRSNCLRRIAENYKDPNLCKKMLSHSAREKCVGAVAINLKDKAICNKFQGEPYEKQECEDRVDSFLVTDKKIFLDEAGEVSAVEIDECAKIKTLEYSKLCVGNALRENIILIGQTDNKKFEDNYNDFYYYRISSTEEECNNIVLEGAKLACLNKLNHPGFSVYDFDLDGLSDEKELWFFTDPGKKDTDDDGLSDVEEILEYHTNPVEKDTDDDRLSDYDEVKIYKTHPNKPDTDGDGISDGDEIKAGTDTHTDDSDKDGLLDIDEEKFGTDINNSDTDGDGMSDLEETRSGYDPLVSGQDLADTDGDGLLDIDEIFYGTDRFNPDTDGDGIPDKIEVDNLTNPLGKGDMDFDGDGLSDKEEEKLGTNPSMADEDWDDLSDYEEIKKYKTNPRKRDTDGDGYSDGEEVRKGYNPLIKD